MFQGKETFSTGVPAQCRNNVIYDLIILFAGSVESLTVSSTLIFTAMVSTLLLKERMDIIKVISILVCILGILCVMQPAFIFKGVSLGYFGHPESHRFNQAILMLQVSQVQT